MVPVIYNMSGTTLFICRDDRCHSNTVLLVEAPSELVTKDILDDIVADASLRLAATFQPNWWSGRDLEDEPEFLALQNALTVAKTAQVRDCEGHPEPRVPTGKWVPDVGAIAKGKGSWTQIVMVNTALP